MADRGRNTNVKIVWSSSLKSLDYLFERIEADYLSNSPKLYTESKDEITSSPSSTSGSASSYTLDTESSSSLSSSPLSDYHEYYSPVIQQAKLNLYTDFYTYAEAKKRYFRYR